MTHLRIMANVQTFNSYLAANTSSLHYTEHSLNAVQGTSFFFVLRNVQNT